MTPAEKNRSVANLHWEGKLCIFSMVSGSYRAFRPLFEYMAKKAYPEHNVLVIEQDQDPNVTRSMRFLYEDGLRDYDYTLITDVDILMARGVDSIIDQHMRSMTLRGTQCYDNYIDPKAKAMLGVHFVTREWWTKTQSARQTIMEGLLGANLDRRSDERALYRIVQASGLPLPPEIPLLWNLHGFHLGAYRSLFEGHNARNLPNHFDRIDVIRALEADPAAVRLYEDAARVMPWLGLLRRWWQKTNPGVVRGV